MAPKKMTLAACLKLHFNMAPKKRRLASLQWIQKEEEVHMGPVKARHPESEDIPTEFKGAIVEAAAAVVSLKSYHAGRTLSGANGSLTVLELGVLLCSVGVKPSGNQIHHLPVSLWTPTLRFQIVFIEEEGLAGESVGYLFVGSLRINF
ncbi:hypothetical protein C3L33_05300, partial [Rhododendron williamsianum]